MTPEELRRIRASLATTATSGVYMGAVLADIVALLAEVDRLHKLFDDAGQGEHNVLALVEHYQAEMMKAQAEAEDATAAFNIQTERIDAARAVLRKESPTLDEVRAALVGDAP